MASGHVNRIKRPNTWLHRPMLQNVKKALANPETSTHDAEVLPKAAFVEFDKLGPLSGVSVGDVGQWRSSDATSSWDLVELRFVQQREGSRHHRSWVSSKSGLSSRLGGLLHRLKLVSLRWVMLRDVT